jgi:hypothetical protein
MIEQSIVCLPRAGKGHRPAGFHLSWAPTDLSTDI